MVNYTVTPAGMSLWQPAIDSNSEVAELQTGEENKPPLSSQALLAGWADAQMHTLCSVSPSNFSYITVMMGQDLAWANMSS